MAEITLSTITYSLDFDLKTLSTVVGFKAANLSRFKAAALPVPPGFVITTVGLEWFLKFNGLNSKVSVLEKALTEQNQVQAFKAAAFLRHSIQAGQMPAELSEEILNGYHQLNAASVSVRSSSTLEDRDDFSFAGQHDSFTLVKQEADLLEKVKLVWSSLWSDRAIHFLCSLKQPPAHLGMAVLIQEMVGGEISGVLFSADPRDGSHDKYFSSAFPVGGSPSSLALRHRKNCSFIKML